MALVIKCVHYNTLQLSTVNDLQLLNNDFKVLISNGYRITLDISAVNTSAQESWGGSTTTLPPISRTRYAYAGYEPLASYNVSSSQESETSSSQPSLVSPAYYADRKPDRQPHQETFGAESTVVSIV